ncbi:Iron(3+)-hydroxamate-binding protein FhuD precursor [compost metagenome]
MDLEPHLIITSRVEHQSLLSQLAPTVVLSMDRDPVYEQLMSIGSLIGKEQAAVEWIYSLEKEAEALREWTFKHLGEQTVGIMRIRPGLLQMYGTMNMGYPLYRLLQVRPPERIHWQIHCNTYYHSSVISAEELRFYEADHLFIVIFSDEESTLALEQLQRSQGWNNYPAILNGNVYYVKANQWLAFDPISIKSQMREAAKLLTGSKGTSNYA